MNRSRSFFCWKRQAILLVAAVAIFVFITPEFSLAQDRSVVSIENAKKLALGTQVTIEGSVTVASGTFGSSFSDAGFQVQDKTGGMYITIKTNLHLTLGQKVRLTGKVTETPLKFQIIETDEKSVQVLSGTALPKPVAIATGKISELTIGKLIKIDGKVTKPVDEIAPYGFRFSVDDGTGEIIIYVSTSTGISSKQMVLGQRVELIGVAGAFNHRYQIYPRSPSDVRLEGPVK
jgi:uncharacterized protein YdeI (BOF family)